MLSYLYRINGSKSNDTPNTPSKLMNIPLRPAFYFIPRQGMDPQGHGYEGFLLFLPKFLSP
ncbi:MAG: hypothetical protein AVO34_06270 [Firmicutes bacterium ML8_F2]|jgi:hypothetical protein|nr:MAG: hypothetical protein AVO34_06270 [Firmicutes bacterium ML8_F2]